MDSKEIKKYGTTTVWHKSDNINISLYKNKWFVYSNKSAEPCQQISDDVAIQMLGIQFYISMLTSQTEANY